MARTLRERWTESPGEQLVEQFIGHLFGIAASPVAIVLGFAAWAPDHWPIYAGLCAGLWITAVREFVDGLPIESWGDAIVDSGFSIAGPVIVGAIFDACVFQAAG